jgi:DNA-binding NtrC family response regulator
MMGTGQNKIRVLIADDEKNLARVLKTELAREGHTTEVASDGREALEKLKEQEFDVLILDLKMPKLGGMDILKEVKKKWVLPPEVIVLTGHGTIPTAVEAIKLGAYTYITKPCKTAEVNLLVKKAYEKQQILRENLYLKTRLGQEKPFPEIVTGSPKIRQILQMLVRIDRQGTDRKSHSPAFEAGRQTVPGHQLRGAAREHPRERALRAREGSLHRGALGKARSL